ncbi:hypothetical protein CRUP_003773 [Coryphaenoides rupestris]|nr:hypothetical protein CRUP_003773 [Coryphaenoides rupestris]
MLCQKVEVLRLGSASMNTCCWGSALGSDGCTWPVAAARSFSAFFTLTLKSFSRPSSTSSTSIWSMSTRPLVTEQRRQQADLTVISLSPVVSCAWRLVADWSVWSWAGTAIASLLPRVRAHLLAEHHLVVKQEEHALLALALRLGQLAHLPGVDQIFCTGVSRKPSSEMSIILCSRRHASKKNTYLLSFMRRESCRQALGPFRKRLWKRPGPRCTPSPAGASSPARASSNWDRYSSMGSSWFTRNCGGGGVDKDDLIPPPVNL